MGLWCGGFSLERVKAIHIYCLKWPMKWPKAKLGTWILFPQKYVLLLAQLNGAYLFLGYPTAYPAAAPAYNPSLYPTNSPSYAPGKEKEEIVVVNGIGSGIY